MPENEYSKQTWILWLCVGAFAIAAMAILLWGPNNKKIFGPTENSTATFVTTQGGKLEILKIAAGKMEFGKIAKPRGFLSFFSSSIGSSGGFYGGLSFHAEERKKQTTYLLIEGHSPDDLIIEIRLLDKFLKPREISSYLSQNQSVVHDARIAPATPKNYYFYEPESQTIEAILEAMARCNLEVLFQYQDPDSGWIDMTGPGMLWAEWPDRYYISLDSWQRNQTKLYFRMVERDGTTTAFDLPNPDLKESSDPLTAATLPFVHIDRGYTLTIRGITRSPLPGEQPFAALDMNINYTGPKVEGLPNGPVRLEGDAVSARDEWGNITGIVSETIDQKSTHGIKLPLNSQYATTIFTIKRDRTYPQHLRSGIPVLEGIVNEAGTSIDFKKTKDAAIFTDVIINDCKISTLAINNSSASKREDWVELSFEIECHAHRDQVKNVNSRIGNYEKWITLVFTGADAMSSGIGNHYSGGSFSSPIETRKNETLKYSLPSESLQPGKKIVLAIHPMPQDEKVEVVLPLPNILATE